MRGEGEGEGEERTQQRCRGGAGERGRGGSAGFEPQRHLRRRETVLLDLIVGGVE